MWNNVGIYRNELDLKVADREIGKMQKMPLKISSAHEIADAFITENMLTVVKSTRTKSLFGTEEHIIEYDFTAGSDAEAEAARKALEEKRKEALTAAAEAKK